MAEQGDVCKHCGGDNDHHRHLTTCVAALKAKLAQAMKVIAAQRQCIRAMEMPRGKSYELLQVADDEEAKLEEMG